MNEDDLKRELINQMSSSDNSVALDAVQMLREKGWLFDSTLRGADFTHAALSDADLRGADLDFCNFRFANCARTRLDGASLRFVNFYGATLISTSLHNANLNAADLGFADLSHSDFGTVDLTSTNLANTKLNGVHLGDAQLNGTILGDLDLSVVTGLDEVYHAGPSTLGIDTLYRSGGNIPEIFLRGCGVPDTMITFANSLIGKPIDFYHCFISYSHADKSFARRVYDTLQGRGIRCWFDEENMLPGDDIYEEIERGIRYWDKVLLCASRHSLTSWWVDNEIDSAFEKERTLYRDRNMKVLSLIPLDLDGFLFDNEFRSGKKQALQSRLAANFNGWEHDNALFEREIERVFRALQTDGGKEAPPESKL